METGQGLRERILGEKSACFGRNLKIDREGSKDRANGMERKAVRSSSGARRARRIVVEWSERWLLCLALLWNGTDGVRFQWVDEFTLKSQLRGALEKLSFEG
jgi:hypothetical protein